MIIDQKEARWVILSLKKDQIPFLEFGLFIFNNNSYPSRPASRGYLP